VYFASDGISSIGIRPWTVFGVGRDAGLTADPTLAIRALAERKPFTIRLTGHMDMQYVRDVADIFIQCLESRAAGAHVFNLRGEVVNMEDFRRILERLRPEAADLISIKGSPVPVAWRMDDSALERIVGPVPRTPLNDAISETLVAFERLANG
jgi:nucleoside-diphosphate-sugar epimerase